MTDRGDEGVSLGQARCVHQTAKAIKVRLEEDGSEFWIPQSVVHDDSEVYDIKRGAEGVLVVARWWAEQEGAL